VAGLGYYVTKTNDNDYDNINTDNILQGKNSHVIELTELNCVALEENAQKLSYGMQFVDPEVMSKIKKYKKTVTL
jgi:hypothetical protein